MIKELKYVFYIIIIFFFIFFVSRYYFSDEYKKKSYRSLNIIEEKINIFSENLVTLESDTNDIIEYVEYQKDKNKKKYHFLKLLKND
jgi:cell shape-determining protein MreC